MMPIKRLLAISLASFFSLCVACNKPASHSDDVDTPSKSAVDAVGIQIADLLSVRCSDGYHFASTGDTTRAYPSRLVKMESGSAIEGNDKFFGYEWKGEVQIYPAQAEGEVTPGMSSFGFTVFERHGRWYVVPADREMPVPVDELHSDSPACLK